MRSALQFTCVVYYILIAFPLSSYPRRQGEILFTAQDQRKAERNGSDSRSAFCRCRSSAFAEAFWVKKHRRPKANRTTAKTNATFENKDRE